MLNQVIKNLDHFKDYFAHARFKWSIRPTDVFIVSYPKSGTTWLAFLIANATKENESEIVTLKNSTRYVPDINKVYLKNKGFLEGSFKYFDSLTNPRFFKVHSPYDPSLKKVVYVLRDPRDVMVSYWHYHRFLDPEFSISLKEFVTSFDAWPCAWDEHVAGWLLEHDPQNTLVVRYHEMRCDPLQTLKRVLDFAGIERDEFTLINAVRASSFENMKKLEAKFGVAENTNNTEETFIRKGSVGGWTEDMDQETVRALEERFGWTMKCLGYELSTAKNETRT